MATPKSTKSTSNVKLTSNKRRKKRTSIGQSRNSKPINKRAAREKRQ